MADWPVAQAVLQSDLAVVEYLKRLDRGIPLQVSILPAGCNGRYYYAADMKGMNFAQEHVSDYQCYQFQGIKRLKNGNT